MKKTVLVTGSSVGIGKDVVRIFLGRGWNVVATMRDTDKSEFKERDSLWVKRMDVTSSRDVGEVYSEIIDRYGSVDVLVNSEGYESRGYLEEASEEEVRDAFNTNFFGVVNTVRAVTPHMRKRECGVIINVSSIHGFLGAHLNSIYSASQFAVHGLSESLQHDLSTFGIKVKLIVAGRYGPNVLRNGRWNSGNSIDELKVHREQFNELFNRIVSEYSSKVREVEEVDVAEIIYACSTLETPFLNIVGDDVKALIRMKKVMSENEFQNVIRKLLVPAYKP